MIDFFMVIVLTLSTFLPHKYGYSNVRTMIFDTVRLYDIQDPLSLLARSYDGSVKFIYYSNYLGASSVDTLLKVSNIPDTLFDGSINACSFKHAGSSWFIPYCSFWIDDAWPYEDQTSNGYILLDDSLHVKKRIVFYEGGAWSDYFLLYSADIDFSDTVGLIVGDFGHSEIRGVFVDTSGTMVSDTFSIYAIPAYSDSVRVGEVKVVYMRNRGFFVLWMKGFTNEYGHYESMDFYYSIVTPEGNIIYPEGRRITYEGNIKEPEYLFSIQDTVLVVWREDSSNKWYDIELKPDGILGTPNLILENVQSADFLPVGDSFVVFWVSPVGDTCYYNYMHKDGTVIDNGQVALFTSERGINNIHVEPFDSFRLLFLYYTTIDSVRKIAMRRGVLNNSTGTVYTTDNSDFVPFYHFHSYKRVVAAYGGSGDSVAVVSLNESGKLQYGVATFGPYYDIIDSIPRGAAFWYPEIASNGNGLFLVVWDDDYYYSDDYYYMGPNVIAHVFDLPHRISKHFVIENDCQITEIPHVTGMRDRFLVTWEKRDFLTDEFLGYPYRFVYGLDSMGEINVLNYKVTDVAFNGEKALAIGKTPSTVSDRKEDTIVGCFIGMDGEVLDSFRFTVLKVKFGPYVVSDSNKFFVVYSHFNDVDSTEEIYGRFIYPDGNVGEELNLYNSIPYVAAIKTVYDGVDYDVFIQYFFWNNCLKNYITILRVNGEGNVEGVITDNDFNPDIPSVVLAYRSIPIVVGYGKVLYMISMYVKEYNGMDFRTYGWAGKIYNFSEISENNDNDFVYGHNFLLREGAVKKSVSCGLVIVESLLKNSIEEMFNFGHKRYCFTPSTSV